MFSGILMQICKERGNFFMFFLENYILGKNRHLHFINVIFHFELKNFEFDCHASQCKGTFPYRGEGDGHLSFPIECRIQMIII